MKKTNAVLLILGVLAATGSAPAQTNLTHDAPASGVNLAVAASPSSLSTSGDTTVDALNDDLKLYEAGLPFHRESK